MSALPGPTPLGPPCIPADGPPATPSGIPDAFALPTPEALMRCTAPGLLVEHARHRPDAIACRAKRYGIYEERSWRALALRVARFSRLLQSLGFSRGERLAIMGDACEEWLVFDLACQALGGITYGIYPTASAGEVAYQLRDGGARIFVAEDQEYVDRVLAIADEVDTLDRIVVVDATALFLLDDARVVRLDRWLDAHPPEPDDHALAWLGQAACALKPEDPAFIVYTSGTTGDPKGALVSHGRHLAGTSNLMRHYPLLGKPHGRTVVYLPLCHVLGRDIAVTLPLLGGPVPHFGESVEELATTLFEVAPTVLFTVPRYLQKFASQVLTAVGNASATKRRVFDWALKVARREATRRWRDAASGAAPVRDASLTYAFARRVAFAPVLNKLGLDRIDLLISGGAPLALETATFWQMLGLNLCEMYGQTETGGAIVCGQRGPYPAPGDVGTAAEGIALRIAATGDGTGEDFAATAGAPIEGEVFVRSPYLFVGYWRRPQDNASLFDADGWLATGDVGRLENGRLRLVDRARDFIVTAGGKTLSPTAIESAVRGSAYIAEVVVFGHARKYVSALIEIDEDAVADWARAEGVVHAGFTALAAHPRVRELIQREIDRANASLARVEAIKRFTILPKALDPEEEGEPVTPTRKVKRRQMYERYSALVEAMYDGDEEAQLQRATTR